MRRNRRTPDRGLPKYVRPINLAGGRLSYAFNLPGWVAKRQPPCPVGNEKLGTDRKAACARAEDVLLPAFHAWLNGDNADSNSVEIDDDGLPKNPKVGTVDWMFVKFKNDRLFHKRERDRKPISEKQKRNHRQGFKLVGGFKLADGRRFGSLDLNKIATTHVDHLYDKLLVVKDKQGNVIEGCECTTTVTNCSTADVPARLFCGAAPSRQDHAGNQPVRENGPREHQRGHPKGDLCRASNLPRARYQRRATLPSRRRR